VVKQLLIYNSAVPLSSARHADISVEANDGYAFSAGVNAVPLLAVEFPHASAEYAIVFAADGDNVMPAVVLGVRNEQNLYLSPEARWKADYIPAFIRRYPFIFSSSADGKSLTLCIDESHPGVNREAAATLSSGSTASPLLMSRKCSTFSSNSRLSSSARGSSVVASRTSNCSSPCRPR
jgi:hypothetical protein